MPFIHIRPEKFAQGIEGLTGIHYNPLQQHEYHAWLRENPEGFVVNIHGEFIKYGSWMSTNPGITELKLQWHHIMLHSASCARVFQGSERADHIKICLSTPEEVRTWIYVEKKQIRLAQCCRMFWSHWRSELNL